MEALNEELLCDENPVRATRRLIIPLVWPYPPAEPCGQVLVGDLMGGADALFVEECKQLGITEVSFLVDTVTLNVRGLAMREFAAENDLDDVRNSVEFTGYVAMRGTSPLGDSYRPGLFLVLEASGGGWMLTARLALNGGTAFVQFPHWDFK